MRKRIDNHLVSQRLLLGEGRGGYLAEIEIRTSGAYLEFGDGFGSVFISKFEIESFGSVFLYYFLELKNGISSSSECSASGYSIF